MEFHSGKACSIVYISPIERVLHLSLHFPRFTEEKTMSHALRYAVTYIGFLLVCLSLGLILAFSAAENAKSKYWLYHATGLELDVSHIDSDLSMMENYARQLSTDSTFVRFSSMQGLEDSGFVYTAYSVMRNLSMRQYALVGLPVKTYIYLPESGYVISPSQFTESSQFYRYYLTYPPQLESVWFGLLRHHGNLGTCFSLDAFGGSPFDAVLAYDISTMLTPHVPAVVWYELDTAAIRERFLPASVPGGILLVTDANGVRQLVLTQDGSLPGDALLTAMQNAAYGKSGMALCGDMQLIRKTGANGWSYMLALPQSLSSNVLGHYPMVYTLVFLAAILFGAALVVLLVRQSMKPLHELSHELSLAQDDNVRMQKAMARQRPALCTSYLRTLLSGHVASNEEFAYMMQFLGLNGDYQYFVLFCNAYRPNGGGTEDSRQETLIADQLRQHLSAALPPQYYTMPAKEYVVLVTYPRDAQDAQADLALRVQAMHTELLEKYGLWFFAGAGIPCTQPRHLWESYEQARTAFRCTARTHVFLLYASIHKDTESWYYPIEISAKLLHFITSGNRQQVSEMFALIHRENIVERRLSMPLLAFLLSDLRNTLLKARFQIAAPQTAGEQERLRSLDQVLNDSTTFQEMEANALALCGFFVKAAEPADPIPEIQRYLQENFSDPSLCLSKLSGLFNISESYLSHLFKARTGENFSAYLENLRMAEAQRRLQEGSCSLSTLYVELGYTNPTTWRRAFKKCFGMTPSEMLEKNAL